MGSRNVRKAHNQHLKNPVIAIAAEYINHALASGDMAIILMAIRNIVDAQEVIYLEYQKKRSMAVKACIRF